MTAAVVDRPIATHISTSHEPEWEHRSELTLAALPTAVSAARLLVRHTVAAQSLREEFAHRLEHVVDELVVHAVATTGVVEAAPLCGAAFDHLQLLVVRLRLVPVRAMVEVWDRSYSPPHPRLGQSPVIKTAEDWGYELLLPGKRVVWCEVATTPDFPQPTLPRRIRWPRADEVTPIKSVHELAFLERVRDGLRRLDETGDP